ncbi:GTP cyclohydrolase, FolE2/MptA family [Streptomyces sp. NPDC003996]
MSPPPDASTRAACTVATAQATHATSLCPCSKAISDDDTHNQRGEITLEVTGTSDTPYPLPVHKVVDLPRAADSAPPPRHPPHQTPRRTHRDHARYGHPSSPKTSSATSPQPPPKGPSRRPNRRSLTTCRPAAGALRPCDRGTLRKSSVCAVATAAAAITP